MKHFAVLTHMLLFAVSAYASQSAVPDTPAARLARETAPQLFTYTQSVLFGELWKRPDLAPRDRSLVTLSALVANGQAGQMTSHVSLALDNGVKPSEIIGLVTHLAFYSGWPNAMSTLGAVQDVFNKRGIDADALRRPSPELLSRDTETEARRAATVKETVAPLAPELARYTEDVLFADLWRQPDLTPRDRSLVTVSALIARGQTDQLPSHLLRGMGNGLTKPELSEVVTHLAFYAGWPRAMSALPMVKAAFDTQRPENSERK